MPKGKNDVPRIVTLNGILERTGITHWDTLLIGDGSGSGWSAPIGSFCTLIDNESAARKGFALGASVGTVILSEALPYFLALLWYTSDKGPGPQRVKTCAAAGRPVAVHIVTDNETIVTSGNHQKSRKAYRPLWACFDSFATMGYAIRFHHVGRDTIALNVFADVAAGCVRNSVARVVDDSFMAFSKRYPGVPEDATLYDINPIK